MLLHYLPDIKGDLERKPGSSRVSAAEILSLSSTVRTCFPILHIALINKKDLHHPLPFPLSSRPHPFSGVPYSPPTIASPCHHNLSISLARPPGLRGLEMETGFVSQLTALLFYFLADHSHIEWSQRL